MRWIARQRNFLEQILLVVEDILRIRLGLIFWTEDAIDHRSFRFGCGFFGADECGIHALVKVMCFRETCKDISELCLF